MTNSVDNRKTKILNAAVVVAALGYFVDIYDLLLFGFVRVKSLTELGFSGEQLTNVGLSLQNWQMFGMLLGGILWGVLGDKLGRVSVLYFSIGLYSVANLLNACIPTETNNFLIQFSIISPQFDYSFYRFIAGIGLAGELGAGITLVSEILPKGKRGYGTMLVASIGLSGALLAWAIDKNFHWKTCYLIGGALGLLLLVLRISVAESGMFSMVRSNKSVKKGQFLTLFTSWHRFSRFMRCIMIGFPTWFVIGILVMLAPEFGKAKGLTEPISPGNAIAAAYTGLILGDIASGLLSQFLRSRVKVMAIFLSLDLLAVLYYLLADFQTVASLHFAHFLLGFSVGFWVIFVTIAAEQFGTNLRATVATSVPNFARGMQVPINESFKYLKSAAIAGGVIPASYIVGGVCLAIAFLGLYGMKDTFHEDLDYVEL